jgi:hypothetical protein
MICDIAPTFKALMDGMAKADPEAFAKIIFNGEYDIVAGLLIELRTLGEVLVSVDEEESIIDLNDFGQILLGRAEIALTCYEHWRRFAMDSLTAAGRGKAKE